MACFKKSDELIEVAQRVLALLKTEIDVINNRIYAFSSIVGWLETLVDVMTRVATKIGNLLGTLGRILKRVRIKGPIGWALRFTGRGLTNLSARVTRLARRWGRRVRARAEALRIKINDKVFQMGLLLSTTTTGIEGAQKFAELLKQLIAILRKNEKICEEQRVKDLTSQMDTNVAIPAIAILNQIEADLTNLQNKRKDIDKKFNDASKILAEAFSVQTSLDESLRSVEEKVNDADAFIEETKQAIQPYIDSASSKISDVPVIGVLFKAVVAVADTVESWVEDIVDGLDFLFGREVSEAMSKAMESLESALKEVDKIIEDMLKLLDELRDLLQPFIDMLKNAKKKIEEIFYKYTGIRLDKLLAESEMPTLLGDAIRRLDKLKRLLDAARERVTAGTDKPGVPEDSVREDGEEDVAVLISISNRIASVNRGSDRQVFGYPDFDKLRLYAGDINELTDTLATQIQNGQIADAGETVDGLGTIYREVNGRAIEFMDARPWVTPSLIEEMRSFPDELPEIPHQDVFDQSEFSAALWSSARLEVI